MGYTTFWNTISSHTRISNISQRKKIKYILRIILSRFDSIINYFSSLLRYGFMIFVTQIRRGCILVEKLRPSNLSSRVMVWSVDSAIPIVFMIEEGASTRVLRSKPLWKRKQRVWRVLEEFKIRCCKIENPNKELIGTVRY
jgi:hypothetical protein